MNLRDAALNFGIKQTTFLGWLIDNPDVAERYARAQKIRALMLQSEVLEILDDGRNDYIEKQTKSGSFVSLNSEHIKRSQLRAEYRERFAKTNLPRNLGGASDAVASGTFQIVLDAADMEI